MGTKHLMRVVCVVLDVKEVTLEEVLKICMCQPLLLLMSVLLYIKSFEFT